MRKLTNLLLHALDSTSVHDPLTVRGTSDGGLEPPSHPRMWVLGEPRPHSGICVVWHSGSSSAVVLLAEILGLSGPQLLKVGSKHPITLWMGGGDVEGWEGEYMDSKSCQKNHDYNPSCCCCCQGHFQSLQCCSSPHGASVFWGQSDPREPFGTQGYQCVWTAGQPGQGADLLPREQGRQGKFPNHLTGWHKSKQILIFIWEEN